MFYVLQNESTADLRNIPILLTDAATGTTAMAGVNTASIYPYVAINGGAFIGGTGPVYESGFGQYVYQMHPAETATLGLAGIHITAPGCRDYDAIAQIAAFNVYSPSAGGGATAGDIWNYDISAISTAGLAGKQLNDAAAGGGVTALAVAQAVWDYDPALFNFVTAGEYLAETRTYAFNTDGNTQDIGNTVWNRDPLSVGDPTTGDKYSAYLYQLGTGTTGYAGTSITAGDVWNYTLTSTSATADATLGNIDTNVTTIQGNTSNISGTVWNTDVSAFTSPSAGYDLTQAASGGAGLTAGDVWDYAGGRTITGGIADTVTTVSGNVLGSVNFIVDDVSLSAGTQASIANTVWSTLTAPYTTHATFGHQILRSDNAATIGEVTLHQSGGSKRVDADVHAFVNNTASATAMLNILTGIGSSMTTNITGNITGNLSGSVGSVSGNVTGSVGSVVGAVGSVTSPVSVATASMTGIAGTVWSNATRTITGGTITTVSDKTGYSLSGTQSFNLTGNITGNLTGSVGSVSGAVNSVTSAVVISAGTQSSIANSVWLTNISGYGSGSAGYALNAAAGGGVALTAGDIWTYNSRTLTSGAGATAGDVWSYVLSNTATAGTNLVNAAAGGNGITAGDVWTYNIGGITNSGTAGKQLNDAAVSGSVVTIVNGPYRLNSTAEGTDGRIDLLQNSVQTINLSLVNGFEQPFNVTGYTLSVDVYDVSSTLVESYVPTVNFASGGNISFDIDTTVTSVIGTYSLVVSLTDGDVIQVGPIQILVRPL